MANAEIILKPCPWCKKTPKLMLPIENGDDDQTWIWDIQCEEYDCLVKPKSQHVSVRKTSKYTMSRVMAKLNQLAHSWNHQNPIDAYEKIVISLDKIKFKEL